MTGYQERPWADERISALYLQAYRLPALGDANPVQQRRAVVAQLTRLAPEPVTF